MQFDNFVERFDFLKALVELSDFYLDNLRAFRKPLQSPPKGMARDTRRLRRSRVECCVRQNRKPSVRGEVTALCLT